MPLAGQPIVIAHHIMWTLYGWWLPNDPRGSTSRAIRTDVLADLGELHYGRKQVQPARQEVRQFYEQAQALLVHPLLSFAPDQFPMVAEAIGAAIAELNYTCYAAAIMPDHVHLLIRKHRDRGEEMIEKIQSLSRKRLAKVADVWQLRISVETKGTGLLHSVPELRSAIPHDSLLGRFSQRLYQVCPWNCLRIVSLLRRPWRTQYLSSFGSRFRQNGASTARLGAKYRK